MSKSLIVVDMSLPELLVCFTVGAAAGLALAVAMLTRISSGEWPAYALPVVRVWEWLASLAPIT